jgi:hypothetical protein
VTGFGPERGQVASEADAPGCPSGTAGVVVAAVPQAVHLAGNTCVFHEAVAWSDGALLQSVGLARTYRRASALGSTLPAYGCPLPRK